MDESIDPELSDGGTSHAGGKHQAGGTGQAGKHQADGPRSVRKGFSRRKMLISGGALAAGFAGLEALRSLAVTPARVASPAAASLANAKAHRLDLPETQFDIGAFTAPAVTVNGVMVAFPPVFTLFATATLMSTPSREDQDELAGALDRIEEAYQFSPAGVFTFVAYGLPYFARFPGKLFDAKVPRLLSDETRFALEEAVPSPTDVSPVNPGITKKTFNVPVVIEANELLFTIRSDNADNVWDVLAFLGGSDMLAGQKVRSPRLKCGLTFTGTRLMFVQQGLPRKVAEQNNLPFAQFLNPSSPMWMGFADQQVNATAPANDVTFAGADGILFTTAQLGDYFDRGSLQHLSHDILDMAQFFDLNAAGVAGRGRDVPRARPVHVPLGPAAVHGPRRPVRQQRRPRLPPQRLPGRRRRGEERGGHRHAARRGHRHERAPDGPHLLPAAVVPDGRREADPRAERRARFRQPRRSRREQAAEAGVHGLRADGRVLPHDAGQPGVAGPAGEVPRGPDRQRAGAVHHRHPAAELPDPAAASPGLPLRRAGR